MHGQCDARPTVTFPAARHRRPLTTIPYLHMRVNNLPKVVTWMRNGHGWNRQTFSRNSNALTTRTGCILIYYRIFCSLFLKQQATESIFEEQLPASLQFFLQYITVRGRPVEYSDAQRHKLRGNEYFRHSTLIKAPVLTLQSCDNQGFEL